MDAKLEAETSITYTAVLTSDEDGGLCAQIAEVPEAISQGRTATDGVWELSFAPDVRATFE